MDARVWLVLISLLAGCAAPGAQVAEEAPPTSAHPVPVPVPCPSTNLGCYEPTVAVTADGAIVVSVSQNRADLARSTDEGANWTVLAPPAHPRPAGNSGDVTLVTAPSGRLYYSAFVSYGNGLSDAIVVAWSDDRGDTWEHSTVSLLDDPTAATYVPDRQWIAFGPGDVIYLTYSQVPTGIWISRSDDAGRTWGG